MSKHVDMLNAYQRTINRIDDFFEYANESDSDREFIHKQLEHLTDALQHIQESEE
jgi:hypothetical protein